MKSGPIWAAEVDIQDCFPSFDGKKLPSLIPLPKEVVDHVIISEYLSVVPSNNLPNFLALRTARSGSQSCSTTLSQSPDGAFHRDQPHRTSLPKLLWRRRWNTFQSSGTCSPTLTTSCSWHRLRMIC